MGCILPVDIRRSDMTPPRDSSGPRDGAAPDGGDGRRRQARRRLAPDGLARDQRQHARAPETKQRVLAAMRQLDYRPNPAARALVTGRSGTLGVVSFDTTLYGPGSTLFAIEQAAHAAGYFITIVSLARPRPDLRAGRRRAPARPGRRRHPRHHAAGGRGRRARQPARRHPARRGRGRPAQLGAAGRRRPVRRRGRARRSSCSTSATRPSGTSPARATSSRPSSASTAGAPRSRPPAREVPPVLVGDWSPRSGYELGLQLAERSRGDRRSSWPTTRWRSASCARCTSAAARSRARSASSASTTSPRRSTSRRR